MKKLLLIISLILLLVFNVMALPTREDLETMDYVYQGQPFVEVTAKDSINLETMNYVYKSQPFVRVVDIEGWPHEWNTKIISKWNTKEFTKWNGLE